MMSVPKWFYWYLDSCIQFPYSILWLLTFDFEQYGDIQKQHNYYKCILQFKKKICNFWVIPGKKAISIPK